MHLIATDIARNMVCVSVCMLVTCMDKLFKNGLTDQDAVYFLLRLSWSPLQPTVLHCGTV